MRMVIVFAIFVLLPPTPTNSQSLSPDLRELLINLRPYNFQWADHVGLTLAGMGRFDGDEMLVKGQDLLADLSQQAEASKPMCQSVIRAGSAAGNLTETCERDVKAAICGLELAIKAWTTPCDSGDDACVNQTLWAKEQFTYTLYVVDALAKVPWGYMDGHLHWTGNYRQCRHLPFPKDSHHKPWRFCSVNLHYVPRPSSVLTKMCTAPNPLRVPRDLPEATMSIIPGKCNSDNLPDSQKVKFGICFPPTCAPEDISVLTKALNSIVKEHIPVCLDESEVDCQSEEDYVLGSDPSAVAVVVLLSILGALLLAGSLYDAFLALDLSTVGDGPAEVETTLESRRGVTASYVSLKAARPRPTRHADLPPYGRFLISFSLYYNSKRALSTKSKGILRPLCGLRFITFMWVLFAHTFLYMLTYTENLSRVSELPNQPWFALVNNASLAGDTFFLLSGLFIAYLFVRDTTVWQEANLSQPGYWALFYSHRLVRILPPYIAVIAFAAAVFPHIASGPAWTLENSAFDPANCRTNWWTNLLFVNNFVGVDKPCMEWTWYIANDMQMYLFVPIVLVALYLHLYVGFALLAFLVVASSVISGLLVGFFALPPTFMYSKIEIYMAHLSNYVQLVYNKPYARCGAFCIGLFVGWAMYRTRRGMQISRTFALLAWLLAVSVGCAVLFPLHPVAAGIASANPVTSGLYAALSRPLWAGAVGIVCFLVFHKSGGIVLWVLSWKLWLPLSRLTYEMFLVHPLVMGYFYLQSYRPHHMDQWNMFYMFFGHMVCSTMLGFFLYVCVSAPIANLERWVGGNRHRAGFGGHAAEDHEEPAVTNQFPSEPLGGPIEPMSILKGKVDRSASEKAV